MRLSTLSVLRGLLLIGGVAAFTAQFQRTNPTSMRTAAKTILSATPAKERTHVLGDTSSDDDAVQKVLSILEKRIAGGPGSLTPHQVQEFEAYSDAILAEITAQAKQQAHDGEKVNGSVPTAPTVASETAVSSNDGADKKFDQSDILNAVSRMDATTVSSIIETGLQMDEATTDAAFWEVVNAVDTAEKEDKPLSADVPRMLHLIFDADLLHLQTREKITQNVTCMRPKEEGIEGKARRMGYIFDDMAHKDLPLEEGRVCEGGQCCDACSRNTFPTFATDAEVDLDKFPELGSLTFNELEEVSSATILQFVRLIERVRRTIAHEYGLPLSTILPLQAYSRKYVAGSTQQGGGGGEGDFVILHTDESTHSGYHYSSVLYLNSQGEDFWGGDFVWNDPADGKPSKEEKEANEGLTLVEQIRRAGRKLTPFHPSKGAAVIFSSGWENMHEVDSITSGTRYAVPAFFTTCPVPEQAYEQMVAGKPKTDDDIADDWLHLLLAHRKETPMESVGRVKELLMKWHYMCTPLSEH